MFHDLLVAAVRIILGRAGVRVWAKEVWLHSLGITVPPTRGADGRLRRKKLRMDVGATEFPHQRTELADISVAGHARRAERYAEAGAYAKADA